MTNGITITAPLNRTIFTRDNLEVMRGLNSEIVDLIYLDPPFNSNRNYSAPGGSDADGAFFKDVWRSDDLKEEWIDEIASASTALYHIINASEFSHGKSMKAYLIMMSVRLLEMHRLLKHTGSVYLHCDPNASHYLKLIMDAVFGKDNFRNEIIWCYRGGGVPNNDFARKHDIILRYSKSADYVFNHQYVPYSESSQNLINARGGVSVDDRPRDLERGARMPDWWTDINALQTWSPERTGYPTQKPLALLERIIKASSNESDIVFDPFCGCATALVAAERLNRRWIGIDISKNAYNMILRRLVKHIDGNSTVPSLTKKDITHRTDIPVRMET